MRFNSPEQLNYYSYYSTIQIFPEITDIKLYEYFIPFGIIFTIRAFKICREIVERRSNYNTTSSR